MRCWRAKLDAGMEGAEIGDRAGRLTRLVGCGRPAEFEHDESARHL
jgi:hypothetical protein